MQILSRNVNFDSRARPWSLVCFRRTRARKACHAREQCRPDATAPNPGSLERTSEARPPRLDGVKPARRTEGLVLTELTGEVLVYDLERHRAHCLNPAAEAAASCVNDCTGKPFGTPCYSVSPVNCEFNGCLCNGAGACTVGGGAPPCTS